MMRPVITNLSHRRRIGILSNLHFLLVPLLLTFSILPAPAAQRATVIYLCADWGPEMKLPAKQDGKPQFNDAKEDVYFLKQVTSKGVGIYLCKMKPDGTAKTEIKELWHNPNYPIDTQGHSCWMDINEKTHKIVLSVLFAGTDLMGLWTLDLDGTNLKQIIKPAWGQQLTGADHPSWTPDGQWIVFTERMRGTYPERFNLAVCDANGGQFRHLFEATDKIEYMQPSVSPDGKQIAFSRYPNGYPGGRHIWLSNIDGSDAHALPNPSDKSNTHGGDYATWSLDGKKLYVLGGGIIDMESGRVLNDRRPILNGKPWAAEYAHWGKLGLLGSANGFRITLTDSEMQTVKLLAVSGQEDAE
jgi:Tol biopolymer transport system component